MKLLGFQQKLAAAALIAGSVGLIACTSGWSSYEDPDYVYIPSGTSSSSSGYAKSGSKYGDYASRDGGGGGGGGVRAECIEPTGFAGRGCFRCEPQTSDELLIACTDSKFEVFDDSVRVGNFNPDHPRPSIPKLDPTPPPYTTDPIDPTETLPPAPACPVATKPNPVMVLGATGFPLETIARAMGNQATIFYQEKGSCDGVAGMLLNSKLTGEVVYFGTDGSKNRCTLTEPQTADITLSTLFASTCAGESGLAQQVTLPANIEDFLGPANTVMFTVPATSKERAISSAAAYRVFGFGRASLVSPWTDEDFIFRRRASSGNQQTVALTLGLNPDNLRGRDSNGSSNMLNALRTSSKPASTIGISSSEIVDSNRDVVKALAYKHEIQPVAFYPDSDPASYDRKNVRDGHYFMWLPLHVLARTKAGEPVSVENPNLDPTGSKKAGRDAAVKRLVYVMVSRQEPPVPSVDLLGALKRTGNVPPCAMHVKRASEAAPLEPSEPAAACDCAFEAAAPGSTTAQCKPCDSSLDCPSSRPVCSFGYCEARK